MKVRRPQNHGIISAPTQQRWSALLSEVGVQDVVEELEDAPNVSIRIALSTSELRETSMRKTVKFEARKHRVQNFSPLSLCPDSSAPTYGSWTRASRSLAYGRAKVGRVVGHNKNPCQGVLRPFYARVSLRRCGQTSMSQAKSGSMGAFWSFSVPDSVPPCVAIGVFDSASAVCLNPAPSIYGRPSRSACRPNVGTVVGDEEQRRRGRHPLRCHMTPSSLPAAGWLRVIGLLVPLPVPNLS